MDIYKECPEFENKNFLIRLLQNEDGDDLLNVYSDKKALPFFNADNCDGDNFYYSTKETMTEAIDFWNMSYKNRWFVRLSIVDKVVKSVIGTIEFCVRVSEDQFNHMGILRVDVRSDYEQADVLYDIFSLVTPKMEEVLGCNGVLTKAPLYAVERIAAIQKVGFTKSDNLLIGKTGYAYDGYWTFKSKRNTLV